MATRYTTIRRSGPLVILVINGIEHRLTETAFLELMEPAASIAIRLVAEREQRRADIRQADADAAAVVAPAAAEPAGRPTARRCEVCGKTSKERPGAGYVTSYRVERNGTTVRVWAHRRCLAAARR